MPGPRHPLIAGNWKMNGTGETAAAFIADLHRAIGGSGGLRCEVLLCPPATLIAVVAETVRSTPYIPPPAYWQTVREACDRHGALLVFDEVMTGFRVAAGGYQDLTDVRADLVTLGKVIGEEDERLPVLSGNEAIALENALTKYGRHVNQQARTTA